MNPARRTFAAVTGRAFTGEQTMRVPTNTTLDALSKSNPALSNAAVARCCKAWKRVYRAEGAEDEYDAPRKAAEAYRAALPPLTSRENCRDFIACIAQGMLLGAIEEKDGGKLLYAAQIALSAAASQEKLPKPSSGRGKLLDFDPSRSESEANRSEKP
jgi:hypothetical protein